MFCGASSGRQARSRKSVEPGRHTSGLDRTYLVEELPRFPQHVLGTGGVASGQGAAAKAGQCPGLVPGVADLAGQLKGLPVALFGFTHITADPVQGSQIVKRLSLASAVTEIATDAQCLRQSPSSAVVVSGFAQDDPHLVRALAWPWRWPRSR